jgi:hypothetical protein
MQLNKPEFPDQNRLDRHIYLGMEEIFGPNEVQRLLKSENEIYLSKTGHARVKETCILSKDLSQIQACLERKLEYGWKKHNVSIVDLPSARSASERYRSSKDLSSNWKL